MLGPAKIFSILPLHLTSLHYFVLYVHCRYIYPNAELSRVEANLACVVGFFVVEITISKYVSASPTTSKCVGPGGLLSMSELVQWWTDAQRRLVSSLDGLEYSNPTDNTRVRSLVDRFIRCLMSYNIKSPKMDEWL